MVARITTPHRLRDALNYNEQKVQRGKAECLHAANYLLDATDMNFYQKLQVMENLNVLNDRATTKTLHVSLNFDPSEKLTNEKLTEIAITYMTKIGFDEQPYLIYRHFDAAHPHLHIVTTTIREDGSRINTHNIGRNQSESARKEIEEIFNLVRAEKQNKQSIDSIQPIYVKAVHYGKDETRRSISNVVTYVMREYKFTSLPEFNAILSKFNVEADRGKADSRIFKNGGIVYRVLDQEGNKIGVPIKASRLSGKPILKNLLEKFEKNKQLREPFRQELADRIEKVLNRSPSSTIELKQLLEKEQVEIIFRRSSDNRIYGVTYIDHKTKCVFKGSDLGKGYAASALISKIGIQNQTDNPSTNTPSNSTDRASNMDTLATQLPYREKSIDLSTNMQLLSPEKNFENVPFQLRRRKRKKRKPGTQNRN